MTRNKDRIMWNGRKSEGREPKAPLRRGPALIWETKMGGKNRGERTTQCAGRKMFMQSLKQWEREREKGSQEDLKFRTGRPHQ